MNNMIFKEEKNMKMMTTGIHCNGSKTSHNKRKYVKEEYINRNDLELVGIGLQLIHLDLVL